MGYGQVLARQRRGRKGGGFPRLAVIEGARRKDNERRGSKGRHPCLICRFFAGIAATGADGQCPCRSRWRAAAYGNLTASCPAGAAGLCRLPEGSALLGAVRRARGGAPFVRDPASALVLIGGRCSGRLRPPSRHRHCPLAWQGRRAVCPFRRRTHRSALCAHASRSARGQLRPAAPAALCGL